MVCICDIKVGINAVVNQQQIYSVFDNDEKKCLEFDFCQEKMAEAKQFENEHFEQLIKDINEYIQYPKKKVLFFDVTQRAEGGYNEYWDSIYIKVPKIEKQQYYCVINRLNKHEHTLKISQDKWIIEYGINGDDNDVENGV